MSAALLAFTYSYDQVGLSELRASSFKPHASCPLLHSLYRIARHVAPRIILRLQ